MEHQPESDHQKWAEKVWANEKLSSLVSEVYIYFQLPELRAQTFEFEIWADRYLADDSLHRLMREDPHAFIEHFELEQGRAMTAPKLGDESERLIASYHRLNVEWAEVWRKGYNRVETALAEFRRAQAANPFDAVARLEAWLLKEQGDGICPFERQARAFAKVVNMGSAAS